ncbi:EF-P 5-aminopentanol modification-associated protein YfmH [Brassicibacter mesophilus]|uniref:EF-P 5-aminopentanol modification-associated protein YfmH n=1 Tax=Brassicibacter mesophilus TaxID=745119 RepID=UPI003D1E1A73
MKNDRLKEEVYTHELENGLKVFYMPKKGYVKKYAIYATNYGSNDNKFKPIGENDIVEVPEGIAHFLEHKLFEEPEGNIFNDFSKLGSYVNAYTNYNQTAYLFSCTDKFYENLELLVKFVQNPYFTDENVEKEKGIIEQEIRMYDDAAEWKVFSNSLSAMYNVHPVRIDIAGTVDSISKIDKEILYKCYNTFYNPANMIIFIIGDVDFDNALDIIRKNQKISEKPSKIIERVRTSEPDKVNRKTIQDTLSVSTPIFNIGYKDTDIGYDGDKLIHKEICTNILLEMLFGNSSEFFQQLYDEGLITNSFGSQYVGNKDYGYSIIGGESESPKTVLERIEHYIKNTREKGLSKEDFNRIKKKLIGYHLMELNSIEYIATNFVSYHFKNSSLLRYLDIINEVSISDVQKRFDVHMNDDNHVLSIVMPK